MDQEIVTRDPELAHALHRRRADPRRAQGRLHGPGRRRLGRPGSRLARSQRRPHLRPAHDGQRRRAQLDDRRRMGRRRGAERDRHGGVRHRRLGRGRAGRDRRRAHQLHPARRRQPLQRHDRRQLRRARASPATTSPAPTCSSAGWRLPGTIKANGDFNPGFGGPIKRDKLWFFLSGRSLFADNYVAEHVLQPEREQAGPLRLRAVDATRRSSTRSRRSTRPASPGRRRRSTRSASRSTRRTSAPARPASARARRRRELARGRQRSPVPAAAFRHRRLEHAGQQQAAARGERHPPRRALGRHGTAGRQAGQHRPPDAGHDLGHRHPQPGHRRAADVSRGRATYNNSWNWNIHYRAAVSYITGSHTFKVGFNNAYGHHENTTYSVAGDAVQLQLHLDGCPPRSPTASCRARSKVNVNRDLGLFVQDKWTTGRWTLSGAVRFDSFKNSFPEQAHRRHVLRTKPERPVPRDRQPELERHHAEARRHLRRVRQRQDGVQGHAQQVPRRLGTTGFGAAQVIGRAEPDPRLPNRRRSARGPTPTATSCPTAI